MKALKLFQASRGQRKITVGSLAIWSALALLALLLGAAIAVLPPGVLIRLLVVPIGLGFLGLCWALRSSRSGMPGAWVFALLMATAALSVIWPRYVFFSVGGPHVNPQTLSVFGALAVTLFWVTYSPGLSARVVQTLFGSSKVGLLMAVWLAWRLLAAALGEAPVLSVIEFVRDTVYLSSFLVIGAVISTYDDGPKWLIRLLLLCGMAVAFAGLLEAFMQRNYFVQFASGGDSQEVSAAIKTIMLDKIRGGAYRAQSTFDHPIVFAQFIAAMIPIGAYALVYERGWFWRLFGLLVIPVGILAILKSGSRAGVVSLAVALVFVGGVIWLRSFNSRGFGKAFAIAALPAFLFGLALAYYVVQELLQGRGQVEASSSSVRLKMLLDGVKALVDSPIWGFGHGMAIYKAGVISGGTGTATIDNYLLTIALDSGYVGLAIFIALIGTFAYKGAMAAVRLPGEEGARIGLIVASVLALVATFAGLSIPNNLTLMWLLVASGLPLINRAQAARRPT